MQQTPKITQKHLTSLYGTNRYFPSDYYKNHNFDSMLVGYARVSTHDQNPELQTDALTVAGYESIYTDKVSGATKQRAHLDELRKFIRSGDTLVVWRLYRIGRSLKDLIGWVEWMDKNGIHFKSLTESIDTGTSGGNLIFSIFGAIAESERNLIRERTNAGLAAARSRGRLRTA